MGIKMNQYFYGFFTAICLSISFVMFTASKSSDLGDITVNSIRVVDNQNGGFIATYNRLGELTTFTGGIEDGSGKIASYDKNKVQYGRWYLVIITRVILILKQPFLKAYLQKWMLFKLPDFLTV